MSIVWNRTDFDAGVRLAGYEEYDDGKWMLLHHAVLIHSDMMDALLNRPATQAADYLNATNNSEQTALMDASRKADSRQGHELVQLLSEQAEIEVNAKDGIERTASHVSMARPPGGNSDKFVNCFSDITLMSSY